MIAKRHQKNAKKVNINETFSREQLRLWIAMKSMTIALLKNHIKFGVNILW